MRKSAVDVLGDLARVPSFASASHPLDLSGRQPQRLAELAYRAACAIRRKGGHQGRALASEALVDARDQLLADVPGKVQVDVRKRSQLLIEEAPDQQLVGDWVDMREACQVADDRGDARASTPPRWQQCASGVWSPHLDRDLAGELEHFVMQQEESRQLQCLDDPELLA